MSILIVDDNSMNAKILEYNLQKHGYQTITVPSAAKALNCLETLPEIQLVISDIMMPEIDGLELLDMINQRAEWKSIPVIMCTALSDVETVQKAASAGCRHYIVKPIKAVQLLHKVREALNEKGDRLKSKSKIISELGIEQSIYDEILNAFAKLVKNTIQTVEKSPIVEPGSENRLMLKNLQESASMLGAERVTRILDTIIGKGEEDVDSSILLRELKALLSEIDRITTVDDTISDQNPNRKETNRDENSDHDQDPTTKETGTDGLT